MYIDPSLHCSLAEALEAPPRDLGPDSFVRDDMKMAPFDDPLDGHTGGIRDVAKHMSICYTTLYPSDECYTTLLLEPCSQSFDKKT